MEFLIKEENLNTQVKMVLDLKKINIQSFIMTADASKIQNIAPGHINFSVGYGFEIINQEQQLFFQISIDINYGNVKLATLKTENLYQIENLNEFILSNNLGQLTVNRAVVNKCLDVAIHGCRGMLVVLLSETGIKSVLFPLINVDDLIDISIRNQQF